MEKASFTVVKESNVVCLDKLKVSMADRVLQILELIAFTETALSLENISSTTGISKPTSFRLLNTLIANGLIEKDYLGRRFQPSAKLCSMGLHLLASDSLRSQRIGVIKRLVHSIGETCNFNILDGNEIMYLDRIETSAPIRLHIDSGMRVPLHCTASGKLFLSYMKEFEIKRILGPEPFKKYTKNTITQYAPLLEEVHNISSQNYSIDDCEYLDGSICVAVPIKNKNNRVVAALAAHGPSTRFTVELAKSFVPDIQSSAMELENFYLI